ncbi:Insulin-induced gene 1 protein [Triplophysa tibetana]|uniref:Insulin-induced gene protein n=1 Tax=Triplophysa tibetana TaxID=1572043 RepID=A0A5A9PQT0_9TELE|nr:Insulin-induced gene 1 protein [Triplophysa tibetana]
MPRLEEHCWTCSCSTRVKSKDLSSASWIVCKTGEMMSIIPSVLSHAYGSLYSLQSANLIRRGLVLFIVGVVLALVLNLLQIQRNVTLFPEEVLDTLFSSAWWIPLCCGTAAVGLYSPGNSRAFGVAFGVILGGSALSLAPLRTAVVGLLHPCLDSHLGEPHKFNREWASVMRCTAVFVGINHASAKLDFANNVQLSLTLAALSLGLWWTFDRSRSGFGIGLSTALLATLIAQLLVYNGIYQSDYEIGQLPIGGAYDAGDSLDL